MADKKKVPYQGRLGKAIGIESKGKFDWRKGWNTKSVFGRLDRDAEDQRKGRGDLVMKRFTADEQVKKEYQKAKSLRKGK